MAIINTNEMLADARHKHYAVGAFNVENMEFVQAVIWAAEELSAPVIIQTSVNTLKYATPEIFINMVKSCADTVKVPVAIHLDHGSTLFNIMSCVKAGYKSVMFDAALGSSVPHLRQNLEPFPARRVHQRRAIRSIPTPALLRISLIVQALIRWRCQ